MKTGFSLNEVLSHLADEGLTKPVEQDAAVRSFSQDSRKSALPWYVKLFVGISAWVAAALITSFLFIIGIIDEDQALFFGLAFCALAILLNRINRTNIFLGQLSLALSLTGQVLAIIGLSSVFNFNEVFPIVAAVTILELILIWLHRDSILRFISALIIVICFLVLIFDQDALTWLHGLIIVLAAGTLYIHLKENDLKLRGFEELISPVGSAVTVSLLGILVMPLLDDFELRWEFTAIALFIFLLILLAQIAVDLGYNLRNRVVIALALGCILLLVPGISMPGILAALIVLVLGFWRNNRGLMGLASVFLIFYFWAYYYSLEWTLLIKSLVLMGSGVTLLVLRYFVVRLTAKAGDEL
jgi:hypothetical protein